MDRLDKIIASQGTASRNDVRKLIYKGKVSVNGEIIKKIDFKVNPDADEIAVEGTPLNHKKFIYIMMNKPAGVICATFDKKEKTVLDLLPSNLMRKDIFPAGRLDKDTVGLVIITNDGISSHKRLSPKHHAEKVYYFETAEPVSETVKKEIESGVLLKDGYLTKPCKVELITETSGNITLTEGKYHEIKRIFGAKSNKITYLKRISFAGITLDETLKEGEARPLTPEEENLFTL